MVVEITTTSAQPTSRDRNPMARLLVETALDLIDEQGGVRGVNLRQIAARANCAHTNAYNYFDSLEGLFWAAMETALGRMTEGLMAVLKEELNAEEKLTKFLHEQLSYAIAHPGHYRLFWLEPLKGEPPAEMLASLDEMRQHWAKLIASFVCLSPTDPRVRQVGQLAHGYFHGEVCKLIGREVFAPVSADNRERVVRNTLYLVSAVTASLAASP